MRKIIPYLALAFSAILLTTVVSSQSYKIDSLKNEMDRAAHDTIRCSILIEIGEHFVFTHPDSSIFYFENCLQLAQKKKYRKKESIALGRLANVYRTKGQYDRAIELYNTAIAIDQELSDKLGVSKSYNNLGLINYEQGNYNQAIDFLQKSYYIKEEMGDKKGMAASLSNIGIVYRNQGYYDKAIEQYLRALKILEELNDMAGIARCYMNIGNIQNSQGNNHEALEYYHKSLEISLQTKDMKDISRAYYNIGTIYRIQENLDKAIEYNQKALEIFETIGDKQRIAFAYNNLGLIYSKMNDYDKALENYLKSLKIREQIGDKRGLSSVYNSLGNLHKDLSLQSVGNERDRHLEKAVQYGEKSYKIAVEIGALALQSVAATTLKSIYKNLKSYSKALHYAEINQSVRDSMFSEEKTSALAEMQTKYETDKKQQEIEKQKLTIEKKEIDYQRQRTRLIFFISGSVLLFLLVLVVLTAYRQKYNSNIIISEKNALLEQYNEEIKATSEALAQQNEQLKESNEQITKQRNEIESQRNSLANLAWELQEKSEEIEKQRNILSAQHKDITDSIVYAQRIQSALLPSASMLNDLFNDHFILYKPKSIVSGDFYWATRINELIIFCVTDCTGHGVPGAFMSMMGISFLNEIVRKEEVTKAAQVLNQLRDHVVASMEEPEGSFVKLDGMDMGLCVLNTKTLILQFAGANIPCWIAASSQEKTPTSDRIEVANGLVELKPDRMPIARFERMEPFSMLEYQLEKGDIIYLATDGFSDQFSGTSGKKFQKMNLMELLAKNQALSLPEQKDILEYSFNEWKNGKKQIDDVTLLGVKI